MQANTFPLPYAWSAWLPAFWSNLLFPGTSVEAERPRTFSFLILLILPGCLLYPCLSFRLFEPDEGRYAEIPREMLNRGEWVVPTLQGQPYLDKPPLCYWLVIASYKLFGVHDWSARLVPALALHLCILLTYLIGCRSLGERPAFWGALLLGLAPGFMSMGRLLILDGLLALWVTLSLLAGFEAIRGERLLWTWWLVAAIACGLGVLTKGPIAVLLLVPPLVAHPWLNGGVRPTVRAWLAFVGVVAAVALPWYLALGWRIPHFFRYFLWEHNVVRFLAPFDHIRPIWFYGPVVLFGLLPGTLLLWSLLRFVLSTESSDRTRRTPAFGFMLLSGGWCLLFFSLSGCKLPTYVMPAFPVLALALGQTLCDSRWRSSAWPPRLVVLSAGLLALGHFVLIPAYARFHSPVGRPELFVEYAADPAVPIVCYPRNCDSVAFYLQREDLLSYRSKETPQLIEFLRTSPRTVLVFTHRHSLESLRGLLPPELRLRHETPLFASAQSLLAGVPLALPWLKEASPATQKSSAQGLCYMAVVERVP